MARTVFVAGIHGAGKSFLCNKVCEKLSISHYGASELIKMHNKNLVNSDKSVADVTLNQDVLLRQFNQLNESGLILLDGHCCLLKDGTTIERVPMSTFRGLQICSIILVEAPLATISERLQCRDKKHYDAGKMQEMLETERQYCCEISKELGVPLIIVQSNNEGISKAVLFIAPLI